VPAAVPDRFGYRVGRKGGKRSVGCITLRNKSKQMLSLSQRLLPASVSLARLGL